MIKIFLSKQQIAPQAMVRRALRSSDGVRSFLIAAALLFPNSASEAATITVSSLDSDGRGLVTVTGPFEQADIEQFRTQTSLLSKAVVAFASDGGNLVAGLEIGTSLRLKGFTSIVPDGARCASACALAWLGGAKRLMGATAQVGFHAAYIVRDGVSSETSAGNALVGAYLNRIGLPDRAVIYITQAAPQDITWLNLADAERLGIDVELFSSGRSRHGVNVTPALPASPSAPASITQPSSPTPNGRFSRLECGSIIDANTGLEWFVGPNADIGWQEAIEWASQLRACGKNWHLPSASELHALFDKQRLAGIGFLNQGRRWPAHLDPIFAAIGEGSWVWTEHAESTEKAIAFNFNQGLEVLLSKNAFVGTVRAFGVNGNGGVSARVVRRFYEALQAGNGLEAASLIVPEKRNGHFSAEAISKYYSNLHEPINLRALESVGSDSFLVHYQFRSDKVHCDGSAEVTTTVRGSDVYITRIEALNGC